MEIWLDTIDYTIIADAVRTGVLFGVTTNPSILSKSNNVLETLKRLLDIQPGPVAVQVIAQGSVEMVEEAKCLSKLSNRIIVKIPINYEGLVAINVLKNEDIPILGTAILYPSQALLAAHHGIAYIAPYFGHMGDFDKACATLKTIVEMFKMSNSRTNILVASLRQLDHIVYCALLGVKAITIKPDLYSQLVANHTAVEEFSERFLADWMRTHGNFSLKEALDIAE
jgi:TalC/MipB family fructose-6-phosphate aldolase